MLSMSVRTTGQLQDGCCVSQFCVARRQERRQERTCCLYAGNERNAIFSLSSPRGQSYEVRHQRPHSPEEDGGRCFVWCKIEEGRTVRDLRYGAPPRFSYRREGRLRDSPEGNGQAARGRRPPGRDRLKSQFNDLPQPARGEGRGTSGFLRSAGRSTPTCRADHMRFLRLSCGSLYLYHVK